MQVAKILLLALALIPSSLATGERNDLWRPVDCGLREMIRGNSNSICSDCKHVSDLPTEKEMKKLTPYLLNPAIGAGVIADNWFGIAEAGNIAIAALWLLILLAFIVATFGDKDKMKSAHTTTIDKYALRFVFAANVFILFAAGWFVTGAALLIAWVAMWIKKLDAASTDSAKAA